LTERRRPNVRRSPGPGTLAAGRHRIAPNGAPDPVNGGRVGRSAGVAARSHGSRPSPVARRGRATPV